MGFKEKYAYKRLYKKAAAIQRSPKLPEPDNIKRVGVIWQPSQKKAYHYLQDHFSKKQTIFRSFCVFEENNEPELDANTLTSSELNWWGLPKPEKADEFLNLKFDLLLNIALEQNLLLDYLTALAQSNFKIGWSPNENNFFDLNINIGENQDAIYLAKQQIFYLGQLNKKDSK